MKNIDRSYLAVLIASAALAAATPAVAGEAAGLNIPSITVTTTPLPGFNIDARNVPSPIQIVTQEQLDRAMPLTITDFMSRNLGSVYINEQQGNPFQPDINFRGYTASPLLGTPQGLSVYMDGVRLNQPFGDVVSWDLIPESAIKSMTLIPGSNPVFGLNSLGGALSIQTKDGLSNPGTSITALAGSFGRKEGEFEYGGSSGAFNWYLTGNVFDEDGWRKSSPSQVNQVFGKLGWRADDTDLKATLAYAANDLTGNGLQEQRLLARDYSSGYTPDKTYNRASFLNFEGQHTISAALTISGNAYYRNLKSSTYNGDVNDDSLDQSVYQPSAADQAALRAAGYTGFPTSGANAVNTPHPFWRCIAQALQRDEPGEKCTGVINLTHALQENYGVAAQAAYADHFGALKNDITVGAAYDGNATHFRQSSELGYLTAARQVVGVGAFGDGVTGGNVDGVPYDTRVDLRSQQNTFSVYIMDTLSAFEDTLHVTASGRYNYTRIRNVDGITPAGTSGTLTATNAYDRFNPAIGLTYAPIEAVSAYAGYSEGNRAPTAVELGCADPLQPCKLPNAFAGDPPLKQIVARSWEAGLRGAMTQIVALNWSAGVFRTTSSNDILFVADNAAGFGYFKNFGKIRRQGIELSMDGKYGAFELGGNYTLLDATFRSPEIVDGTGNSTSSAGNGLEGTINISPGNRIPLTPRNMLKFHADYEIWDGLTIGAETLTLSGMYARGNENNLHQPDGNIYIGEGKTKGYTLLALRTQYQITKSIQIFARCDNVLDKKYATSEQLAGTPFDANGNFIARAFPAIGGEFPVLQSGFYAPGAPRMVFGGIKMTF